METFTIKRGMVFFLDDAAKQEPISCTSDCTPKKKRPYLVLSNDKCNASSNLIHVAPILSRSYDPKRWYCVPFQSTCGRDSVVDVSAIMLIDKSLCTEVNYSAAVSQYTQNQNLMNNIKTAIKRQFSIDDSDYYEDYSAKAAVTAIQQRSEQPVVPNIHLTINLNGVPVGTTVSAEAVADNETTAVSEPVIEEPVVSEHRICETVEHIENSDGRKIAKAVKEVKKLFDTANTDMNNTDDVVTLNKHYVLSDDSAKIVNDYILENHKCFGGSMTGSTIARHFNVADSTINRRVKKLLGQDARSYLTKRSKKKSKSKKSVRAHLPESLYEQFVKDYNDYGSKYCVKTYAKYGFYKASQIYNLVARIQEKLEIQKKLEKKVTV